MPKKILMVQDWLHGLGIYMDYRKPKKLVQLACDVENFNSANVKRMVPEYMVMDKLDGVYALVPCIRDACGNWHVKHFGRSGKELSGCDGLNELLRCELEYYYGKDGGFSMVLISEVCSDGPLAKLSGYLTPTRVAKKLAPEGMGDNFHEMLSLGEFCEGLGPRTAVQRHEALYHIADELCFSEKVIPYMFLSYADAKKRFRCVTAQGGEGIIGRDPDAPWKAGQKNEVQWKMKERIDFECEVIGVATGKKGSKYEDMVAKLIVAFRAFGRSNGELIVLPVGSGLTDDERRAFTEDPCKVLGRIAKIKAKSYTEFGNLREPVIEEWREDKDEGDFPFKYGGRTEKTIAGSHWTYTDIKEHDE